MEELYDCQNKPNEEEMKVGEEDVVHEYEKGSLLLEN